MRRQRNPGFAACPGDDRPAFAAIPVGLRPLSPRVPSVCGARDRALPSDVAPPAPTFVAHADQRKVRAGMSKTAGQWRKPHGAGEKPPGSRGRRGVRADRARRTSISGSELAFGTAARMGPGYFPILLSILIIAIGVVVGVRGLTIEGPPIEPVQLRPICFDHRRHPDLRSADRVDRPRAHRRRADRRSPPMRGAT